MHFVHVHYDKKAIYNERNNNTNKEVFLIQIKFSFYEKI
jgi:hypothetical protein